MRAPSEFPFVSIIIIVRNEARNMPRCMEQILAQTYPRERLELIVADGESTDNTRAVIESYKGQGLDIQVLGGVGLGRSQGLNAAIRASRGEYIARLDARTSIGSDYLIKLYDTIATVPNAWNVGGVQRSMAKTTTQFAIGIAMSHPFGIGNAQGRLGRASEPVDSVYLGFFKRQVFAEVGFFDEEAPVISEDSDLNQRIREAGHLVFMNAGVDSFYYPRERIRDLGRLYFRYGGARAGNFLKHRKLTSMRQVVAPAMILATLVPLALALVLFLSGSWAAGAGLIALSLAVTLAYFFGCSLAVLHATKPKKAVQAVKWTGEGLVPSAAAIRPRLMAIFPLMHWAWGLGFLRRITQRAKAGAYWGY